MRLPALGLASLLLLPGLGCVSNEPFEPPGVAASWEFPVDAPRASVSLWPATDDRARRRRHQIEADPEGGALAALSVGKDPYFTWQLATPIPVPAVHLEVDSVAGGRFQVFWTSLECPVFREACSVSASLPAGRQVLDFPIGIRETVRDVRIDLPEQIGQRVRVVSAAILTEAELATPWTAGSARTEVLPGPLGLKVRAGAPDPWIVVLTPGLRARHVTAVEVTMRGPSGPPQLYWAGEACKDFAEDCSARLAPVDAGALTHRTTLTENPRWTGDVRALRFDPGPDAGEYRIERIALVHD